MYSHIFEMYFARTVQYSIKYTALDLLEELFRGIVLLPSCNIIMHYLMLRSI